jgi:bifunctional UDP-N-acetylglucosamine pyrophosphorylase/glucosamine-1-phosphate N-acetyltransferase
MTSTLVGIVLAGGIGSRFRSRRPKIVHDLLGRPMVGWAVDALRAAGCDDVVVVASPATADDVRAALPDVRLAVQAEPRGTGDAAAVGLAAAPAAARVLIAGGDTPCLRPDTLRALADAQDAAGAPVAVLTARFADPHGYGRVVRADDGGVARIVEERDADAATRAIDEINAGVYAADAAFLRRVLPALTTANAQGELYLVDVVGSARAEGQPVPALCCTDPSEIHGINDRGQFAEAAAILRGRLVRHWQRHGVGFLDPDTVWIEASVELASDVVVGPQVMMYGHTRVAAGARIDTGCVLRDCRIGADAHLKPYVVAEGAEIAERVEAGPFAHLRSGTVLAEGSRVGNFVETKKTRLGPGSKANHLSYLGDAEVGAGVNIGAGTITCNYDGVDKHRTVIGDGAFIGSDTQLVAPVTVGAGAVVGAGTTVTRDVPADALTVSRTPQRDIDGWARRNGPAARKAAKAGKNKDQS